MPLSSADVETAANPRRFLPIILAITGMGVLTFSLIAPTLPDLAEELGVSDTMIGAVQAAVAVPGIGLAIFIGYLADRRGRRFIAIASLLVFGVAGASGFLARSFWALVAVRAVQGVGTSGILSLGVILIGDLFPAGRERRWALGVNSAGLTVTGIVSPIVGGALAQRDPFLPFLVFGLALPLAWLAMRLPAAPPGRPPPPLRHVRSMIDELKERGKWADFLGLLPFSTFALIVFAGLGFTAVPLYLDAEFGLSSAGRGLVQSLLSIGSTTGSLNTARLAERLGSSRVFTGGFTLTVVGFTLLAAAPMLPAAGLGLLLLGLGLGLSFPLLQDFVASSVSGRHRGAAVGLFVVAVRSGQSVGPILGSSMAVTPGTRPTFGIAAGLCALAILSWRPLRRAARRMVARSLAPAQPSGY